VIGIFEVTIKMVKDEQPIFEM